MLCRETRAHLDRVGSSVCRVLLIGILFGCGFVGATGYGAGVPVRAMPPAASPPVSLPEAIYWKQHLFLIPYQWGSAAEPGAAQVVLLFVSKDRGATWQKISEAKPDVKAFNYRAEGDGEYWFAVRTIDKQGRAWPQGPYQPELRVVVDTTLPRVDEVRARLADNGMVEIQARASDLNLDPGTWKFEWQVDAAGAWQPITQGITAAPPVANAGVAMAGSQLHAYWQPPTGVRPIGLRGIISDRAGNSATYQARVEPGPGMAGPLLTSPVVSTAPTPREAFPAQSAPVVTSISNPQTNAVQPWASVALPQAQAVPAATPQPAAQIWPAANAAVAPFRLWTGGTSPQDDGVTAYGTPPVLNGPAPPLAVTVSKRAEPQVGARFATVAKPSVDSENNRAPATPAPPQFTTLEPYRESSADRTTPPVVNNATTQVAKPAIRDVTPIDSPAAQHSPTSPPKLVGSRTFALEYDLEGGGGGGVTKVELWGTRDGGRTWNRYAQDDDNRSPLIVTVDNEGLYGFRIVVQNAGGPAAVPPRSGDEPELWVSVDLKRPVVELTAIERGQGNLSDHLILRWRASDNNLEPRPIALFYSSRPTGPWSAIATSLENTGEYAWRVERYVPARFYLRIEAHDTAANLAAYQTRDPVEFSPANLAGRLRSAEPMGATAVGTSDAYR
jgi:hypothetical protein